MNQAIIGKSKLLQWYDKNRDFPYFFIINTMNKDSILDSSPDVNIEEYGFERGYQDLLNALDLLSENSNYFVKIQKKFKISHPGEKREQYYRHIEDTVRVPKVEPAITGVGIYGMEEEKYISKIEKRSEELFHSRWITDQNQKLIIENAELKIKLETAIVKIKEFEENTDGRKFAKEAYNDLKPIFPELIGLIKPYLTQKNQIAGIPKKIIRVKNMSENTETKIVGNEEDRLIAALSKLATADANFLPLIEKSGRNSH